MENNNNNQSFWQFSDQLRLQNASLADLSLNDSIWSVNSFGSKRPEDRRNFDIRVGGGDFLKNNYNNNNNNRPPTPTTPSPNTHNHNNYYSNYTNTNTAANISPYPYDYKQKATTESNDFNNGWKLGPGFGLPTTPPSNPHNSLINGGFNKGIYSKPYSNHNQLYNSNFNLGVKGYNSKFDQIKNSNGKGEDDLHYARYQQHQHQHQQQQQHSHGAKGGKKNKEGKKDSGISNNKDDNKNSADKRFKTLPPSEALPRNEKIGGYIFVCNNDTMEENLKRQLFGLPPRYRDSVRAITPGLPLFLYNYSTHQLHGIYEAASFGGTNIDAYAWEDKKNLGESRFPAQVRVQTRRICEPLDEDAFRPILHHYDGPKFRLELSIPEAISLLDIFEENIS